jgi:O-antigen/teichoic acid export membrane protein
LLFAIFSGWAGYVFFSQQPDANVQWVAPWFALVALTGASIAFIPCSALLRGCHQVAAVNRYQMAQAVTGNLAIWACMLLGANLWAAVAVAAVKLFWDTAIALVPYPRFFVPFWNSTGNGAVDWRTEIWPLQWKLALQGMFGFLATSLFTPVMFHYHGPEAAGQMGMTWTALTTLQFSAIAWVSTRAPMLGTLVAQRNFTELNRVFKRVVGVSFALLAGAGVAFVACVLVLNAVATGSSLSAGLPPALSQIAARLASRMLPPLPTALLTAGVVLNHVPMSLSIYVRAHKVDPLILWTTAANIAIGLLVWQLGSRYGAMGAACGYLAIVALVSLPGSLAIFRKHRREWSRPI